MTWGFIKLVLRHYDVDYHCKCMISLHVQPVYAYVLENKICIIKNFFSHTDETFSNNLYCILHNIISTDCFPACGDGEICTRGGTCECGPNSVRDPDGECRTCELGIENTNPLP